MAVAVMAFVIGIPFLREDAMQQSSNRAQLILFRVLLQVIFMMGGFIARSPVRHRTSLLLYSMTLIEMISTSLFHVLTYYQSNPLVLSAQLALGSLLVPTAAAMYDVGFLRCVCFLAVQFVAQGWLSKAAFPNEHPHWSWMVACFGWFALYSYMVEKRARQGFVQKCQLKLSQSLAQEAHRLHRFLTDHTLEMICVHDTGSSDDSKPALIARIKYVSKSCTQLTGWTPLELYNRSAVDFIHPADTPLALQFYNCDCSVSDSDIALEQRTVALTEVTVGTHHVGSEVYDDRQITEGADALTRPLVSMGFDDLAMIEGTGTRMKLQYTKVCTPESGRVMTGATEKRSRVFPLGLPEDNSGSGSQLSLPRTPKQDIVQAATGVAYNDDSLRQPEVTRLSCTSAEELRTGASAPGSSWEDRTELPCGLSDQYSGRAHMRTAFPAWPVGTSHTGLGRAGFQGPHAGSIQVRFTHKTAGYMWLEVSKNMTSEGMVCVYRDASWRHAELVTECAGSTPC
jgi:PAS domain-containing protein